MQRFTGRKNFVFKALVSSKSVLTFMLAYSEVSVAYQAVLCIQIMEKKNIEATTIEEDEAVIQSHNNLCT